MIGLAVDETPDTVRMFYNKYKLETEIGPKPKLENQRCKRYESLQKAVRESKNEFPEDGGLDYC